MSSFQSHENGDAPAVALGSGWTLAGTSKAGFSASAAFLPQTVDPGGQTGTFASLAVIGGRPAIAYRRDDGGDLYFVRSVDASGIHWPALAFKSIPIP